MDIRAEIIDKIESFCKTLSENCIDEELKYKYLEIIMGYIQISSLNELKEILVILRNNIKISSKNLHYFEQLKKAVSCLIKLKEAECVIPSELAQDNPSQFYKEILEWCEYYKDKLNPKLRG